MNKASLFASAAVAALLAGATAPAFAQGAGGPFADVPVDHWAYKSVDDLQKAGIVIGYPDGTFGGKRAMTRYEFAVAIDRLLQKIPTQAPTVDLTPYVKKDDLAGILAPYALKSDLDALTAKEAADIADIRKLTTEFQTELTTLGVDVDAVKHRLDALEGRVNAIEAEQKRVKVGANINIMARANNTFSNSPFVTDLDGYKVGTGGNYSGGGATPVPGPHNALADARVLHDVDISVKGRLSDTASAEAVINYGNYLPFLGSIASYSNQSTALGRSAINGEIVNQTEAFTVYKAVVEAATRLPLIGGINVTVGRLPIQFTPYTLKLIDTDSYFYNPKTSLGDIPVDGGKIGFKFGGLSATAFAAKTDPIAFVSDETHVLTNTTGLVDAGYGLFAGAGKGAFGNGGNGFASAAGRPEGSLVNPNQLGQGNGAMFVEQMAGVRAVGDIGKINFGGTYLVLAGGRGQAISANQNLNFNRVFVYGGDVSTHLTPVIGVTGSYTKSDTGGPQGPFVIGGQTFLNIGTHSDITNKNEAYDAALTLTPGAFTLIGGYKHVGPYFGAPGAWDKLGSWTNPVDIKGPYVTGKYAISTALAFEASGKFYEGTGEANGNGGITTADKITNAKAGFKYNLTSPSAIDLGVEETQYKIGENSLLHPNIVGQKPTEYLVNVGYGYAFTPATSFKLGYQWINYIDHGTGFDPNGSQRGGVATTQFSVKF